MTATPEQTAAVLRRAADLIDEHGWTRRSYYREPDGTATKRYTPGCSMCALGAILRATADDEAGILESASAHQAMVALKADIGGSTHLWNDAPGRTASEVVAQMRSTADRLERGDQ